MNRNDVLQPAIDFAERGWILDREIGGEEFQQHSSTSSIFNKPDNLPYQPDELFVQTDLAVN